MSGIILFHLLMAPPFGSHIHYQSGVNCILQMSPQKLLQGCEVVLPCDSKILDQPVLCGMKSSSSFADHVIREKYAKKLLFFFNIVEYAYW